MTLFSDRGTPDGYHNMHGYSGHTFKWTKPDGSFVYVQIHCKTDQGNRTFNNEEAAQMSAEAGVPETIVAGIWLVGCTSWLGC